MFRGQCKPEKCRASRKVDPSPLAKGSGSENNRRCREERDWQIGHDDGQVPGNRWVDGEAEKSTERNARIEYALQRKCQGKQQEAVQPVHGHSCASLDGIGVVLPKNGKVRKLPFSGLSLNWRSGSSRNPVAGMALPTQSFTRGGCSGLILKSWYLI